MHLFHAHIYIDKKNMVQLSHTHARLLVDMQRRATFAYAGTRCTGTMWRSYPGHVLG
jgi:hypothetical protein